MASDATARSGASAPKRGAYAKSTDRKSQIVDAATAVFAETGYNGGSLREIAAQLGLSLTTLTHHFPVKTQLLQAVLSRSDERHRSEIGAACRDRGVRAGVLELVEANFARPMMLRLFAVLGPECSNPHHPGHAWFVARYARTRRDYAQMFAVDQELGRVPRHLDPDRLSTMLIAVWDGLQLQWLIDPGVDMLGAMNEFFDRIDVERSESSPR